MQLVDIRTQVRQRANMETSQFVTDAELLLYINASYGELYDLLVSRFEDYFLYLDPATGLPPQFTLTAGQNMYALPSNLYKLRGLDVQVNSPNDWNTVSHYNFAERNSRSRVASRIQYGLRNIFYRIMGNNIFILPPDQAAGTYRIWFIPRLTKLVNDTDDTASTALDFEEYIIVDAAIKCLIKEESDPGPLMAIKEQLKARIEAMASNRDAGARERVGNVRVGWGPGLDDFFPR